MKKSLDLPDLKKELSNATGVLESFPATAKLAELFRSIAEECDRNRLRIGVIGITSSGKSTFLNAIIGEHELLPEQAKATTNLLVYCRRGQLQMEVYYDNGRPPEKFSGEEVTPRLVKSFCTEDHNPKNRKRVTKVIISTPSMRFDDQFELVDTPGLDAFGLEYHEELTLRRFLRESDIVIYMTTIRNPLKKADLRVLEKIIQQDVRVVFVQSGIDLECNDTQSGRVLESCEEKLRKHLKRLKNDVQKHAPKLKAWHYAQVSSKWAKGEEKYADSRFKPLLESIEEFGLELRHLIAERLSKRACDLLTQSLGVIDQKIHEIKGEKEEAEKKAFEWAETKKRLEECRLNVERTLSSEFLQWGSCLNPDKLVKEINDAFPESLPEEAFQSKWEDKIRNLEERKELFLDSLDQAEEICCKSLRSVNLDVSRPRNTTLMVSITSPSLPYKYERHWYTLWLHEHKELDRDASISLFDRYAKNIGENLVNHLNHWWEKCTKRYLDRVKDAISNLENIEDALSKLSSTDLELSELVQKRADLAKLQSRIWNCNDRNPGTPEEPTISRGCPPSSRDRSADILEQLLIGYRELGFHRCLLNLVNQTNDSSQRPVLICLGVDKEDHKKLTALLRHDLRGWRDLPQPSPCVVFHGPGYDPGALFTSHCDYKVCEEDRAIWKHLTLISIDDQNLEEQGLDLNRLFSIATSVCVFVNLSQISHSIKELNEAVWTRTLSHWKQKIFYIDIGMHMFDGDRMHELVTQSLPELWGNSPYGERPYFLTRNYEYRYTKLAQLGTELHRDVKRLDDTERRAVARHTVQDWQSKGISVIHPFTEELLVDVFYKIICEANPREE